VKYCDKRNAPYKGKVMRIALGGFLGWIGHFEGRKPLSTLLRALGMINGTCPYKSGGLHWAGFLGGSDILREENRCLRY